MAHTKHFLFGGLVLILAIGILYGTLSKAQPAATSLQKSSINGNETSPAPKSNLADPQDIVPGLYKNPIQNGATKEGFVITESKAENNVDQNGQVISDHLELTLQNTAGKDLSNFEVYYTITDATANIKEGYSKKLAGFILKQGATQTIHFDNKSGDGHFTANKQSVYYKSSNQIVFDVIISTPGYKMQTVQVTKAAGGAEVKD